MGFFCAISDFVICPFDCAIFVCVFLSLSFFVIFSVISRKKYKKGSILAVIVPVVSRLYGKNSSHQGEITPPLRWDLTVPLSLYLS